VYLEQHYVPSAVESAFEECVASNISFFEGMRGIFAFMVLNLSPIPCLPTASSFLIVSVIFLMPLNSLKYRPDIIRYFGITIVGLEQTML